MEYRKVFIKTFGCQMNEYDSDRIRQLLSMHGYQTALSYRDADIFIINTCAVRKKAEDKIFSEIGRLKKLKSMRSTIRICIIGCLAQLFGEELVKRYPYIDFVVGTKQLLNLPFLLAHHHDLPCISVDMPNGPITYPSEACPASGRVCAFVSIMQGCNNYCSYCIVPYVRGHEWSRSAEDILHEVSGLVSQGVKEVTLLGQNVNSYGKTLSPRMRFSELLSMLDSISGLERIRFTTSHPRDLTEDLINSFKTLSALCEHIHLPLQSGSNVVLKRMNRGYTREQYLEKIALLRDVVPDIGITSDIIVGFPGETEYDFQQTLECIEMIRFDDLFVFHYTPRPGTAATSYPDTVTYQEKIRRLMTVNDLQRTISLEKNRNLIGNVMPVLFDNFSKKDHAIAGRTRNGKVVNCESTRDNIGTTQNVLITDATVHSLTGTIMK